MSRLAPPKCRGCEEKYEACQDTCPKMLAWKEEKKRRDKQIADAKRADYAYNAYRKATFAREDKKKR